VPLLHTVYYCIIKLVGQQLITSYVNDIHHRFAVVDAEVRMFCWLTIGAIRYQASTAVTQCLTQPTHIAFLSAENLV